MKRTNEESRSWVMFLFKLGRMSVHQRDKRASNTYLASKARARTATKHGGKPLSVLQSLLMFRRASHRRALQHSKAHACLQLSTRFTNITPGCVQHLSHRAA